MRMACCCPSLRRLAIEEVKREGLVACWTLSLLWWDVELTVTVYNL